MADVVSWVQDTVMSEPEPVNQEATGVEVQHDDIAAVTTAQAVPSVMKGRKKSAPRKKPSVNRRKGQKPSASRRRTKPKAEGDDESGQAANPSEGNSDNHVPAVTQKRARASRTNSTVAAKRRKPAAPEKRRKKKPSGERRRKKKPSGERRRRKPAMSEKRSKRKPSGERRRKPSVSEKRSKKNSSGDRRRKSRAEAIPLRRSSRIAQIQKVKTLKAKSVKSKAVAGKGLKPKVGTGRKGLSNPKLYMKSLSNQRRK
ncbi:unnamed protein product [Orchesella dallaii]|uniref:Uncharacterized protein n=1 Tax=Orchesella dallaii TaxID=48710 RepID=A0ABP1S7T0_9HEXA